MMPSVVLLVESTSSNARAAPGVACTSIAGLVVALTFAVPAAGTTTVPALLSLNAVWAGPTGTAATVVRERSVPIPSPNVVEPVVFVISTAPLDDPVTVTLSNTLVPRLVESRLRAFSPEVVTVTDPAAGNCTVPAPPRLMPLTPDVVIAAFAMVREPVLPDRLIPWKLVAPLTLTESIVPATCAPTMRSAPVVVVLTETDPEKVTPPALIQMPGAAAAVPVSVTSIDRRTTPVADWPYTPPAPLGSMLRPATTALVASLTTSAFTAVRTGLVPAGNSVSAVTEPSSALVSATPAPSSLSPVSSTA
jgi:hypothetical protein